MPSGTVPPTTPLTIHLTENQRSKLAAAATEKQVPMTAVVRWLIDKLPSKEMRNETSE